MKHHTWVVVSSKDRYVYTHEQGALVISQQKLYVCTDRDQNDACALTITSFVVRRRYVVMSLVVWMVSSTDDTLFVCLISVREPRRRIFLQALLGRRINNQNTHHRSILIRHQLELHGRQHVSRVLSNVSCCVHLSAHIQPDISSESETASLLTKSSTSSSISKLTPRLKPSMSFASSQVRRAGYVAHTTQA